MSIKTESIVEIYKVGDEETTVGNRVNLTVRSVWNTNKLVEIEFSNHTRITLSGSDLKRAIDAALNAHSY